jgi:hypothetical protein
MTFCCNIAYAASDTLYDTFPYPYNLLFGSWATSFFLHDAVSNGKILSMEFSVLKDCCKRHLIAPTGLEPVCSIAVRNTPVNHVPSGLP